MMAILIVFFWPDKIKKIGLETEIERISAFASDLGENSSCQRWIVYTEFLHRDKGEIYTFLKMYFSNVATFVDNHK